MHHVATLRRAVLCALVVPALVLAACGGDNVPGNAVAKVEDELITKKSFDHWMNVAAISAQGPAAGGKAAPKAQIPDAPEYTQCIANKKKTAPKPAKGQPKPKDSDFKAQCKQEYEGLRDQVMQLLIQNQWVTGEAKEQKVKVSEAEVKKQFEQQKKQSFPKKGEYEKFLKTSGFTEADIDRADEKLGAVPVPCFPPLRAKELDRFHAITVDCAPTGIVIDEMYRGASVIYVDFVRACQEQKIPLNYVAHVTGHGWRKLMRLEEPFVYRTTTLPGFDRNLRGLAGKLEPTCLVAHVRGRGDLPLARLHDASERIEKRIHARRPERCPMSCPASSEI